MRACICPGCRVHRPARLRSWRNLAGGSGQPSPHRRTPRHQPHSLACSRSARSRKTPKRIGSAFADAALTACSPCGLARCDCTRLHKRQTQSEPWTDHDHEVFLTPLLAHRRLQSGQHCLAPTCIQAPLATMAVVSAIPLSLVLTVWMPGGRNWSDCRRIVTVRYDLKTTILCRYVLAFAVDASQSKE